MRFYNIHPLLAGPIAEWPVHLERVRAMRFDAVYVNAFFAPGGSQSIYAVADHRALHPRVKGDATGDDRALVRNFVDAARSCGLDVFTDLVAARAAIDGRIARENPDWLRHYADGTPVQPVLGTPHDRASAQVMADLVELDYARDGVRAALIDHFEAVARHWLEAGIAGFRCSSAHKLPAEVWRELIGRLRRDFPEAKFLCAALGCPIEQVTAMRDSGFDYVLDSFCWWNFHDAWYLDQQAPLLEVGATVAFPEDHNTPRLAVAAGLADPAAIERLYRARYLAAVGLSCGTLMPMGFEYGCTRRLDPVTSSIDDWRAETVEPQIDITGFIAEANGLKDAIPHLRARRPQRRVTAPEGRIAGFMRFDAGSPTVARHATALLVNPTVDLADGVGMGGVLAAAGGYVTEFEDVTPLVEPIAFDAGRPATLDPLAVRIFEGRRPAVQPMRKPSQAASVKAIRALVGERVAIEKVTPELDGGRFPVKRMIGDVLEVEADIFGDGHDKLAAVVRYRRADESAWHEVPMAFVDNDRWGGRFALTRNARYVYTVQAWRDVFASWCLEVGKKHDAGLDLALEMEEGRQLVARTAAAASGEDAAALKALSAELGARAEDQGFQLARLLSAPVAALMRRADLRQNLATYHRELEVICDRTAAAFAAWYEIFPRSMSDDPQRHGTFRDVIAKLPYVQAMGFDVLYFPPIHPIGRTNRKGRNNSLKAFEGDPGSPYAIGAAEGGHDALHPELGSFDDFRALIEAAAAHGLEIAIDFAIQCSPDHPWIKAHPEWFEWRPDGTLKFAENPPKKYEDISNVSFYTEGAIPGLWLELRDVILFWVARGVKIFRVDNPHTKAFPFWEWMIREVQDRHPDTVFLAEAFTRPKVMARLAKVGFTQSYSYFTWRETKEELTEYLTELTQKEAREHMRPNFFVNTPDINPVYLQGAPRAAYQIRAVLASTLSTLWGLYSGFELCEGTPVPGKEEYLDSEKYQIRAWDWDRPGHIRDDVTALNRIRRDNPALWQFTDLTFAQAWDDHILVYTKISSAKDNAVMVAVNLDPHQAHGCAFEVPLWRFGLGDHAEIACEDLLSGRRFTWTGKTQHVWLDPAVRAYAIWRLVPPGL